MLKTFRSYKFQSYTGLILGILSWFLPGGVVFGLAAVFFGLVGLQRSISKDKNSTIAALIGIILGTTSRLGYAYYTNTAKEISILIAVSAVLVTVWIVYNHRK